MASADSPSPRPPHALPTTSPLHCRTGLSSSLRDSHSNCYGTYFLESFRSADHAALSTLAASTQRPLVVQLLIAVVRQGQPVAFHAGQTIVAANTRNQTLWIVLSGRCAVVCSVKAGGLSCPPSLALLSRKAHTQSLDDDRRRLNKRTARFECELRRLEAGDVFDEVSSWREHRGQGANVEFELVAMSDVELLKVCAVELHKRHPAIYAEMYFDAAERSKYYAGRMQKIVQTITPDDSPQPPQPPSFVTSSRQPIHTAHVRAHVRSAVWRGRTSVGVCVNCPFVREQDGARVRLAISSISFGLECTDCGRRAQATSCMRACAQAYSRVSAAASSVDDHLLAITRDKRLASHWLPELRSGSELNRADLGHGALYFNRHRGGVYHRSHPRASKPTPDGHNPPRDHERAATMPLLTSAAQAVGEAEAEADRVRTAPKRNDELARRLELLRVRSLANTPVAQADIDDGHFFRPMRVATSITRRKKPRWQVAKPEEPRLRDSNRSPPILVSSAVEVLVHDYTLRV